MAMPQMGIVNMNWLILISIILLAVIAGSSRWYEITKQVKYGQKMDSSCYQKDGAERHQG